MKLERAIADIQGVIDAGRLPHALLVVGAPRGNGAAFVEHLLQRLFRLPTPDATRRHVDIHWLEPESKSRTFLISKEKDVIRPELQFIAQTSYEGGWKALVFLFADCLAEPAQNVLLKTLEEPPTNSLIVMVTSKPANLLPTIRSRMQLVDVDDDALPDAPWLAPLLDLLRNPPPLHYTEILAYADALAAPLRDLKGQAEAEETDAAAADAAAQGREDIDKKVIEARVATRVKEMRENWFRVLQLWQADVLAVISGAEPRNFPADAEAIADIAARTTQPAVLASIRAIERARDLLDHNMREAVVLPRLARALALPAKA